LFRATDANSSGAGLHHMAFEVASGPCPRPSAGTRRFRGPPPRRGADRGGVPRSGAGVLPGHRRDRPGERARPSHEWKAARSLEAAIAAPVAARDTRLNAGAAGSLSPGRVEPVSTVRALLPTASAW
jgi:hypothetical protein